MKRSIIRYLLTGMFLFLSVALQAGSYWQRAVVNYTRQQYHSGNQNWQIVQSREGWMYFANNKGLLEFDGSSWHTYPLPGNAKVRSVCAVDGAIYVGALGQFGRFVRTDKGRMTYERLSEPVEKIGQLNVWNIHHMGSDTYFQCDTALYVNDTRHPINDPHGLSYSAVLYNRLYVTTATGIYVLTGHKFSPLQGIDIRNTSAIVAMLPYEGRLLLVSREKGLFLYGDSHLEPVHTAAMSCIHEKQLSCAAISGHLLVLGTLHTTRAADSVSRIIHAYSGEREREARSLLSASLKTVCAQQLYRTAKDTILLREILTNTPAISHLIREGKEEQIPSYMEMGLHQMRTLKQAAYGLRNISERERDKLLKYLEL